MRKLIIIFLASAILIGSGSYAIMQQLELGPFNKVENGNKQLSETNHSINLDPLVISIIQGETVAATIKLELEIITKLQFKNKIQREITRLKDAYVRDLHSFFPRLMSDQTDLDINALKKRLMKISNRVLGPGVITNIEINSALNI
ncbi:MAG: hypothetical protein ACJZ9G_11590 [Rhodospirillales bacterium]|tara:strand:+ start:28606 stop:29043 length:438 start_codon:yes stop_codon:yes gene_type:complete